MVTESQQELIARFRQQMAETARGELFRRLRSERHWSQATAAHNVGVTEKTWRTWEKGGNIEWKNARRAASVLEVDPEELVSYEPEPVATGETEGIRDQLRDLVGGQALLLAELEKVQRQLRELRATQRPDDRKRRASDK